MNKVINNRILLEKKKNLLIMKAKLKSGDSSLVKDIRLLKKSIARVMSGFAE